MTVEFKPVPPFRSNYSKSELIRDVEFYYPNLQGVLKRLLDAYIGCPTSDMEQPIPRDTQVTQQSCPHCGSTFTVHPDA